jgi:CDP-6-deoxy-D-xylo-4-hexulose-3-dehydrase
MSTKKKIWYAANQFQAYGEDEIQAVTNCLRDGILVDGPKTKLFEEKVSTYFNKKFGLFVNSGSSANLLALLSISLDYPMLKTEKLEVITPACTFNTTLAPIIQIGFVPIFCDVELNTFVTSLSQITEKITDKTVCIMIPNLIGNKIDWKGLREYIDEYNTKNNKNIVLIEDTCDMLHDTTFSDIATTSFYASHVMTASGTGGMVLFNNEKYYKRSICGRDWGRLADTNNEIVSERFNYNIEGIPYDYKFLYGIIGYNFKSSEMNAAFGLVQLSKLDAIKVHRRKLFDRYISNLSKSNKYILPYDKYKTDWLALPLLISKECKFDRYKLLTHLEDNNVQTRVCFSGNITKHPAYLEYKQDFENSDDIMKNSFLVGCHQGMTEDDVDYVCNLLLNFEN